MYLKDDIQRYRIAYQGFHVSSGALYTALKKIRNLVKREDEPLAA